MAQSVDLSEYSKRELRDTAKAIRSLGDEAKKDAQEAISKISQFGLTKIQQKAYSLGEPVPAAIAASGRIRKTSVLAEIAFGSRRQLTGGATTQINTRDANGPGILGGWEFGSKLRKQFPSWAKEGRFIYPTLKAIQPDILKAWEEVATSVIRKWSRGR